MLKKYFVLFGAIFIVFGCVENEPNVPEKEEVKKIMDFIKQMEVQ